MLFSHGHCGRFVNNAFLQTNRKMILWVDSIPTPGKSKIMSEIEVRTENPGSRLPQIVPFFSKLACFCHLQVAKGQTQTLMKKSLVCKNQHFDSVSTWCPFTLDLFSIDTSKQITANFVWMCQHIFGDGLEMIC